MPSAPPPLTVFTPIYRVDHDYFALTMNSVLSQSFGDFEYLLINDGDPADAERILDTYRDPRIRVINQPARQGLALSRNRGLHEARAELIAMIDGDDWCEPERFAKQVAFLREQRDHILVGSDLRLVDEHSRPVGYRRYPRTDAEIKPRMILGNCIAQPAVIARRQALIAAGGYTTEFAWAEDYDLWLRAARLGKFHNLPEALVSYRFHDDSGKTRLLKPALRDSTRLKIHAIRRYGYPATPRALLNVAMHAALLPLPDALILWLFKKLTVRAAR